MMVKTVLEWGNFNPSVNVGLINFVQQFKGEYVSQIPVEQYAKVKPNSPIFQVAVGFFVYVSD